MNTGGCMEVVVDVIGSEWCKVKELKLDYNELENNQVIPLVKVVYTEGNSVEKLNLYNNNLTDDTGTELLSCLEIRQDVELEIRWNDLSLEKGREVFQILDAKLTKNFKFLPQKNVAVKTTSCCSNEALRLVDDV